MVGPYNCKVEEVFRNDVDISVVGEVDKNLGVPAPARLFLQPSSPLGSYLPLPPANIWSLIWAIHIVLHKHYTGKTPFYGSFRAH